MKIPKRIQVGGQQVDVEIVDKIMGKLGICSVAGGYIKISKEFDGTPQSESSQYNTFIHEVIHCILDTMGRGDLSGDETFVSTFAGFATEVITSIKTK